MPPEKSPALLNSADPYMDLTPVRCANKPCASIVGYANATSPTRTLKLVCSFTCAASYYKTNLIRCNEV